MEAPVKRSPQQQQSSPLTLPPAPSLLAVDRTVQQQQQQQQQQTSTPPAVVTTATATTTTTTTSNVAAYSTDYAPTTAVSTAATAATALANVTTTTTTTTNNNDVDVKIHLLERFATVLGTPINPTSNNNTKNQELLHLLSPNLSNDHIVLTIPSFELRMQNNHQNDIDQLEKNNDNTINNNSTNWSSNNINYINSINNDATASTSSIDVSERSSSTINTTNTSITTFGPNNIIRDLLPQMGTHSTIQPSSSLSFSSSNSLLSLTTMDAPTFIAPVTSHQQQRLRPTMTASVLNLTSLSSAHPGTEYKMQQQPQQQQQPPRQSRDNTVLMNDAENNNNTATATNDMNDKDALDFDNHSMSVQLAAAQSIGTITSWTKSTLPYVSNAISTNIISSFTTLYNTRLKSWTLLLLKHSLSTGSNDSRNKLLRMLNVKISITSASSLQQTMGQQHPQNHQHPQQQELCQIYYKTLPLPDAAKNAKPIDSDVILPLLFEIVLHVSIEGATTKPMTNNNTIGTAAGTSSIIGTSNNNNNTNNNNNNNNNTNSSSIHNATSTANSTHHHNSHPTKSHLSNHTNNTINLPPLIEKVILRAPGTISAIIDEKSTNKLTLCKVNVQLDTGVFLKSMVDQARMVVLKAVAYATNETIPLPSNVISTETGLTKTSADAATNKLSSSNTDQVSHNQQQQQQQEEEATTTATGTSSSYNNTTAKLDQTRIQKARKSALRLNSVLHGRSPNLKSSVSSITLGSTNANFGTTNSSDSGNTGAMRKVTSIRWDNAIPSSTSGSGMKSTLALTLTPNINNNINQAPSTSEFRKKNKLESYKSFGRPHGGDFGSGPRNATFGEYGRPAFGGAWGRDGRMAAHPMPSKNPTVDSNGNLVGGSADLNATFDNIIPKINSTSSAMLNHSGRKRGYDSSQYLFHDGITGTGPSSSIYRSTAASAGAALLGRLSNPLPTSQSSGSISDSSTSQQLSTSAAARSTTTTTTTLEHQHFNHPSTLIRSATALESSLMKKMELTKGGK